MYTVFIIVVWCGRGLSWKSFGATILHSYVSSFWAVEASTARVVHKIPPYEMQVSHRVSHVGNIQHRRAWQRFRGNAFLRSFSELPSMHYGFYYLCVLGRQELPNRSLAVPAASTWNRCTRAGRTTLAPFTR